MVYMAIRPEPEFEVTVVDVLEISLGTYSCKVTDTVAPVSYTHLPIGEEGAEVSLLYADSKTALTPPEACLLYTSRCV